VVELLVGINFIANSAQRFFGSMWPSRVAGILDSSLPVRARSSGVANTEILLLCHSELFVSLRLQLPALASELASDYLRGLTNDEVKRAPCHVYGCYEDAEGQEGPYVGYGVKGRCKQYRVPHKRQQIEVQNWLNVGRYSAPPNRRVANFALQTNLPVEWVKIRRERNDVATREHARYDF
jgi:hypothetical protein